MGRPVYGENVSRTEVRHGEPETMDDEFMNLMIEWGRSCWTARNGMIYRERRQRYTMERQILRVEARVYLNVPKEEALVPIENSRATTKNVRNMPNMEIAH